MAETDNKNQNLSDINPPETAKAGDSVYFVVPPKQGSWFGGAAEAPAPVPASAPVEQAPVAPVQANKQQNTQPTPAVIAEAPAWAPPQVTNSVTSEVAAQSKRSNTTVLFIIILTLVLGVGAAYAGYVFWYQPNQAKKTQEVKVPEPELQVADETPQNFSTADSAWLLQYFGVETCAEEAVCGDTADQDRDGLTNIEEFTLTTDPANPDGDNDGLADGDEVNIFGGSPTNSNTASSTEYNDGDDARGGYDSKNGGVAYTAEQISMIGEKISTLGLHQPSITTLGDFINRYTGPSLPEGTETSPEKVLDRDTQRLTTVRIVGAALLAYKESGGKLLDLTSWADAVVAVKPMLESAANTTDPINQSPFVYTYTASDDGSSFNLSYYSETQKRTVQYSGAQAVEDAANAEVRLRDSTRMDDLEQIRQALLIAGAAASSDVTKNVFPKAENWQEEVSPKYLSSVPQDPQGESYKYTVKSDRSNFELLVKLELPPPATTEYYCNLETCDYR